MGLKTSWDLPRRSAAQTRPRPSLPPSPAAAPRSPPDSPAAAQHPGKAVGTLPPRLGRAGPARARRAAPRRAPTSTRAPGKKGRRVGPPPFIQPRTSNRGERGVTAARPTGCSACQSGRAAVPTEQRARRRRKARAGQGAGRRREAPPGGRRSALRRRAGSAPPGARPPPPPGSPGGTRSGCRSPQASRTETIATHG